MSNASVVEKDHLAVKAKDAYWADVYPEIAQTEVTLDEHTSETQFTAEIEKVFRRTWLFVGVETDMPQPGSYVVREFPTIAASIILIRGSDQKVRGFHNACRHRGAKLLAAGACGRSSKIVCPFHGWAYSNQGKLVGLPDQNDNLRPDGIGLVPVSTRSWNGLVFVNLDKDERESFDEFLGPLQNYRINDFPFTTMEWESFSWRMEVNANWKVVKDLFMEGYHVPLVHSASVARYHDWPQNPYFHPDAFAVLGLHHRLAAGRNPEPKGNFKPGPAGSASVKYGGPESSRYGKHTTAPGTNPDDIEYWSGDAYTLFPNFSLNIFGPRLWHYHIFEPVAVDKTIWENRIFFPKSKNVGELFAHSYSRSIQEIVGLEDLGAAELNQEGMKYSAMPALTLHDEEIALKNARRVLREYLQKN